MSLSQMEIDIPPEVEAVSSDVEDDISELEDDSSETEDDSSGLEDDSSEMEDDFSEMEDDSSEVEDDSLEMEDDCSEVEDDSSEMEDDSSEVEDDSSEAEDDSSEAENVTPEVEAIFRARLSRILGGIWHLRFWYSGAKTRVNMESKLQEFKGFDGYAAHLSGLFTPKMKVLFSQPKPPTQAQLEELDRRDCKSFATYLVLVLPDNGQAELYGGSATNRKAGWHQRLLNYLNRNGAHASFLVKHMANNDSFRIVPFPVLLRPRNPTDGPSLCNESTTAMFIESVFMVWMQTLPKGGGYEKLLKYSPYKREDLWYLRKNTRPSLREWPKCADLTPEQLAKALQETKSAKELRAARWAAKTPEQKKEKSRLHKQWLMAENAKKTPAQLADDKRHAAAGDARRRKSKTAPERKARYRRARQLEVMRNAKKTPAQLAADKQHDKIRRAKTLAARNEVMTPEQKAAHNASKNRTRIARAAKRTPAETAEFKRKKAADAAKRNAAKKAATTPEQKAAHNARLNETRKAKAAKRTPAETPEFKRKNAAYDAKRRPAKKAAQA